MQKQAAPFTCCRATRCVPIRHVRPSSAAWIQVARCLAIQSTCSLIDMSLIRVFISRSARFHVRIIGRPARHDLLRANAHHVATSNRTHCDEKCGHPENCRASGTCPTVTLPPWTVGAEGAQSAHYSASASRDRASCCDDARATRIPRSHRRDRRRRGCHAAARIADASAQAGGSAIIYLTIRSSSY